MVTSVSKLREEIMALSGVDILEADGETFKSTYKIIEELSKVWKDLSDISRANILEQIAGKRGSVAVSAAIQNFSIAQNTMQTALTGSEGSMKEQLEVWENSIQASLDRFHVAFQELSADLIDSGFVKGLIDAGTAIIKVIDELVKHIGVLGTALTGLGVAKMFTTATSGAKAVSGWGSVLSTVFAELATNTTTATERMTAMQIALTALKGKASGAGSALSAMFGGLGSLLASPVGIGVGVVGAIALIHKIRKQQQAELAKQASETTDSWNESKTSIEEYKQKYTELNEKLNEANLSESERIGIKQQLLNLQNEIVTKYGDQVSGIDLVNGGLQTQLGILSNINAEVAKRNLRENDEAYKASVDEMTKTRTYTLNSGSMSGGMGVGVASEQMQKQLDDLYASAKFNKRGDLFEFTGDATDFDEAVNVVLDGLEQLKEGASDYDKAILQSAIDNAQEAFTKNNEILKANQENYKAYLEQSLYADGFGDELAKYSKLVQEYNELLAGNNVEEAYKKRSEMLAYYRDNIESALGGTQYEEFFNGVTEQIDTASERLMDWRDIVDDETTYASNKFLKSADSIRKMIGDIKRLELDGVDIQAILGNPQDAMYGDLSQLAKLWDSNIDLTDAGSLQAFADFLMKVAYGADTASESIDLTKSEFDDFLKSASASIDTLDKVNAALVNSFKSGGLSARIDEETGALTGDVQTILSAYKKELGDGDIDQIFERTANGIIVNRDALRALQAQQENTTKAEFIERIKEAEEHLAMATTDEERQAWQTRLDNVKLLASAYDGATSAYQKWVDAQNMGEAGDQYDTIASTAIKRGKELYDKGLVGTNEFRAIAQLYTDQDLALASIEEVTKAYEDGVDTVKKYFTEGQEGAVAFADKLVELGAATKEGDFYNFEDGINTSDLAEKLGISVDLVEAAFKKLGDYGFDIHFMTDDQLAEFDSLTEKAEEAQDKLKELRDSGAEVGDTKLIDIDLSEIDTVDEMKSALDQLNEVVASPEIDPESAEAYQQIIDVLTEKLRLLSETDIGNEVNFKNLDSAYTVLGSLQERISAIDNMNATSTVDVDVMNDDEVQSLAEQIENFPPEIKTAIGVDGDDAETIIKKMENKEIKIPVEYLQPSNTPTADGGTTTVNVQYSQGDLPTIAPQTVQLDYEPNPIEANVVAKLDSTEVENYKPEDHNPIVKYSKDSSEPDNYEPSDKYASVNYTINIYGKSAIDDLPDSGDRYITYHINTVGNAPGNYKGTVPKSTFQGMAHAGGTAHANGLSQYGLKRDENSLINELGAEIVVRPSEDSWMIFNDGMPTFAQLKRGDVVFSADQTRDLLSKGWTKNYASILGGAFANGTITGNAHVRKVVGGGSFKKATSSSKGGGGNGGNGGDGGNGGGSDKSTKEAKEFSEVLDEIEIKIDRIERSINNLDAIASNTFNDTVDRLTKMSTEISKVNNEINIQRQGYTRYMQEAKKYRNGLSKDLIKQIQNGRIDIKTIKDEDTWKKIESYKKWWNSRHLIHLNAGKLRRHINYNARMKYA